MRAALDLAVAREQRQDRQPGRVGRRPALRAQLLRAQVPHGAGAGRHAPGPPSQRVQLVEPAAVAVQQQRVAVAVRCARPRCGRRAGSGSARGRTRPRSRSARASARCAWRRRRTGSRSAGPRSGRSRSPRAAPSSSADRAHDRGGVRRDRQRVDPLVGRERGAGTAGTSASCGEARPWPPRAAAISARRLMRSSCRSGRAPALAHQRGDHARAQDQRDAGQRVLRADLAEHLAGRHLQRRSRSAAPPARS